MLSYNNGVEDFTKVLVEKQKRPGVDDADLCAELNINPNSFRVWKSTNKQIVSQYSGTIIPVGDAEVITQDNKADDFMATHSQIPRLNEQNEFNIRTSRKVMKAIGEEIEAMMDRGEDGRIKGVGNIDALKELTKIFKQWTEINKSAEGVPSSYTGQSITQHVIQSHNIGEVSGKAMTLNFLVSDVAEDKIEDAIHEFKDTNKV